MHVLNATLVRRAIGIVMAASLARRLALTCMLRQSHRVAAVAFLAALMSLAPSVDAQQSLVGRQPGIRVAQAPQSPKGLVAPPNWSFVQKANALVAGQRCMQRPEGRVACKRGDNGAFVYNWPISPDMVGLTVDAVSLTRGVSLFPPIQRIAPGQTQLTLEIAGAKAGDTVRLLKKLMSPGSGKGRDGDVCCDVEQTLTVPQAQACTQPVSLINPGQRPRARPPASHRPEVAIDKQCAVCVPGAPCTCRVTMRNVGSGPLTQPVGFRDETRETSTNTAVRVASFKTDGPDWRCTKTAGLTCELPAGGLKPLSSRSVTLVLEAQPVASASGGRMRNCATLQGDSADLGQSRQRESCAEVGSDIVVSKSAAPRCRQGEQCSFDIAIINRGQGPFSGQVTMCNAFSIDGVPNAQANIVSIEPSLGCSGGIASTPFNCQASLQIDEREPRTFRMTVRLPQPDGRGQERSGRVCFGLFAPSAGPAGCQAVGAAANSRPQATPASSATSLNAGAACIDFVSVPRCPGDLVLQGNQCTCPNNMDRHGDDSCRPACAPGQRREGNSCVSAQPTSPPVVAPLPAPFRPPPDRSPTGGGPYVVPPPSPPPAPCPTGQLGTPPHCRPAPCPAGQVGTPPYCRPAPCPAGQVGTPPYCQPAPCPAGQVGTPPNCRAAPCPA